MRNLYYSILFGVAVGSCTTLEPLERDPRESRQPGSEQSDDTDSATEGAEVDRKPKPYQPIARRTPSPDTKAANPAVTQLLQQAQSAKAEGDYDRAISYCERAYRISYKDPRTSMAMAEIFMVSDRPAQAEQWAMKAIKLYRGHERRQLRAAWALIAESRTSQGNYDGARAARAQVDQY